MAPSNNVDRRTFITASAVVGTAALAGCFGGDDTFDVTISGAPSGSTTDAAGQALARAVNEYSDTVNLTVTESGGWVENSRLYDDGEVDAIGMDNFNGARAIEGEPPYDDEPIDDLPYQGFGFDRLDNWMMAVDGTDIETTDDLVDRPVWVVAPGQGTRVAAETVFIDAALWDNMDRQEQDTGELGGEVEEGTIEAFPGQGSLEVSLLGYMDEVDARNDVHAIEASDEFVEAIQSIDGLEHTVIEPYGFDQDVTSLVDEVDAFSLTSQFRFGSAIEDEAVYEIMRVSHEEPEYIQEADESYLDHSDPEDMTEFMLDDQPVHPGAAEFYEDHGVDVPWDVGE